MWHPSRNERGGEGYLKAFPARGRRGQAASDRCRRRCRPRSASGTASGSGVSRLSQAGVFEAFFEALASLSRTAHLVQMFDSTVVRAHVSAAGAKGGKTTKPWAARAGASRPRSISRSISMAFRSPFTSRKARRATVLSSRSCSILGRTSRPGLRWATKDTTARVIARPPARGASVR